MLKCSLDCFSFKILNETLCLNDIFDSDITLLSCDATGGPPFTPSDHLACSTWVGMWGYQNTVKRFFFLSAQCLPALFPFLHTQESERDGDLHRQMDGWID